jgi:hypothetical protein
VGFPQDPPAGSSSGKDKRHPERKKKKREQTGGTNAQKQPALSSPSPPSTRRNTYHKWKLCRKRDMRDGAIRSKIRQSSEMMFRTTINSLQSLFFFLVVFSGPYIQIKVQTIPPPSLITHKLHYKPYAYSFLMNLAMVSSWMLLVPFVRMKMRFQPNAGTLC